MVAANPNTPLRLRMQKAQWARDERERKDHYEQYAPLPERLMPKNKKRSDMTDAEWELHRREQIRLNTQLSRERKKLKEQEQQQEQQMQQEQQQQGMHAELS
ncbi:MAG: hypothetical protein SGARI_002297 [Bacillariaceae sp.]